MLFKEPEKVPRNNHLLRLRTQAQPQPYETWACFAIHWNSPTSLFLTTLTHVDTHTVLFSSSCCKAEWFVVQLWGLEQILYCKLKLTFRKECYNGCLTSREPLTTQTSLWCHLSRMYWPSSDIVSVCVCAGMSDSERRTEPRLSSFGSALIWIHHPGFQAQQWVDANVLFHFLWISKEMKITNCFSG